VTREANFYFLRYLLSSAPYANTNLIGTCQKEPLSRALRGRPFEHEEYMEILYPDVVGSGGAPKRIMKPKRKGPDALPGCEDTDMPGTAVLNLAVEQSNFTHGPGLTANPGHQRMRMPGIGAGRPTQTTIPPRTNMANTSALTPPDETANHTRKRFAPVPLGSSAGAVAPPDHRHSTGNTATALQQQNKRRRISSQANYGVSSSNNAGDSNSNASGATVTGRNLLEEGVLTIAELLRARAPPRWPEQALDIFFRDFADEDMDLQLKIAEKALADEIKAMVFCKMSPAVRKHWVKRLREMHNRPIDRSQQGA
jgi:hypothetical protein